MNETKLVCENTSCHKVITNKISIGPALCQCCYKVLCFACYEEQSHTCKNKQLIITDRSDAQQCSRCRNKLSIYQCINCNNECFCQDCCQIIHSMQKFAYHNVTSINQLKGTIKGEIHKHKAFDYQILKLNLQNHHKKSPSYLQLQLTGFNHKVQLFDEKDFYSNNSISIRQEIESFLVKLKLKKSQTQIEEISVKEKWQKLHKSIDDSFTILQQKIAEKHSSIKKIITQQAESNISQINKLFDYLKQAQNQAINIKSLAVKNNKQPKNELMFQQFLKFKFKSVEEKLNQDNLKNIKDDFKPQISKQFVEYLKRIGEEIQTLSVQPIIKHFNESKLLKNIEYIPVSLKQKDKKKSLLYSTKNKKLQTSTIKKGINIDLSSQDHELFPILKSKKRRTSIQLYQMNESVQVNQIQNLEKDKRLGRIKSYEFLSSTKASLSSINDVKTKKKNLDQLQLKNDCKGYLSSQQLPSSFIRTKIESTSLIQEIEPNNFLTKSSELLPSIQTLPPSLETIKTKSTLCKMRSPKHTTNVSKKVSNSNSNSNSNKTFSGTFLNTLNSPTNKLMSSGFKSPKFRSNFLSDTKQQTFNQMHTFDENGKERLTIKKNPSSRLLSSQTKQ